MSRKRARSAEHSSPTSRSTPISSTDGDHESREGSHERGRKWRAGTVYDVVAGRLTTNGFLSSHSHHVPTSQYRDTLSHGHVPLRPGEALFRDPRAPERFEEDDLYSAHRHLLSSTTSPGTASGTLPSSDLLEAIHAYTSDFYAKATRDGGRWDWRSLDETALLALGILIDEAAGELLGQDGDLVFVEGERVDEDEDEDEVDGEEPEVEEQEMEEMSRNGRPVARSKKVATRNVSNQARTNEADMDASLETTETMRVQNERRAKRRSTRYHDDDY